MIHNSQSPYINAISNTQFEIRLYKTASQYGEWTMSRPTPLEYEEALPPPQKKKTKHETMHSFYWAISITKINSKILIYKLKLSDKHKIYPIFYAYMREGTVSRSS